MCNYNQFFTNYFVYLDSDANILVGCYSDSPMVTVSSSPGDITLVKATDIVEHWHAHDYEAWITAFNYLDTNIVWSGEYRSEVRC